MYSRDLAEIILTPPAPSARCCLRVVSGYASAAMARRKLTEFPSNVGIELVVGMAITDGLSATDHNGFRELVTKAPERFECGYIAAPPAVHAKVYVWLADDVPVRAFVGSANFTQSGLLWATIEAVAEADPQVANNFCLEARNRACPCTSDSPIPLFDYHRGHLSPASAAPSAIVGHPWPEALESVTISLLDRHGNLPQISGLNWGHRRKIKRNPDQAYIRVPAAVARSGYFPPHGAVFAVQTDNGPVLNCKVTQQNDKAIETFENNSILGKYFRDRLGLASGSFVTRADLEEYGRTDVTFYRLDSERYFLDFSV